MEQAVSIGLSLVALAWGEAQKHLGTPDWVKYVNIGVYVAQQVQGIVREIVEGGTSGKYDNMTPAEIKSLLWPKSIEEIEDLARLELEAEQAGG